MPITTWRGGAADRALPSWAASWHHARRSPRLPAAPVGTTTATVVVKTTVMKKKKKVMKVVKVPIA
jgi:hypothetical protein